MTWRDTFRTATEAVRTHRLRSALTMLGILIGITAVVLTVGLGQGAKAKVQDQINELGTNLLVDLARQHHRSTSGTRGGFGSASTLTHAGRRRAASTTPPRRTSRRSRRRRPSSVSLVNGSTNWTTTLTGTTPSWKAVRSRRRHARAGSSPRPTRRTPRRSSCSAPTPCSELFDGADPIGQTVSYNGVQLEVIGVLDELSSSEETSNNDLAIVPLSTYSQRLVGGTNRDSVSSIYVKATSAGTLSAAYQEANALLLNTHRITSASRRRLLDRDPAVDPRRGDVGRRHAHGHARRASRSSRCSSAASA